MDYVGDAKYKLIDSGLGLSSDYYQLLAYTTALDLAEGVLVYCQDTEAPVPPKVVTVRHAGKRLHSWALTLAGGPADLDQEIDELANWIATRVPLRVDGPIRGRPISPGPVLAPADWQG